MIKKMMIFQETIKNDKNMKIKWLKNDDCPGNDKKMKIKW